MVQNGRDVAWSELGLMIDIAKVVRSGKVVQRLLESKIVFRTAIVLSEGIASTRGNDWTFLEKFEVDEG